MKNSIIVRYGEIALKSELVRRNFERILIKNIHSALGCLNYELRRERGRIFIDTDSKSAVTRLAYVPGIVSVSPAVKTVATIDEISSTAVRIFKKIIKPKETFAVRTNRTGKHVFSSMDVNMAVGSAILSAVPKAKVDLSFPKHEIFIEIREKDAYIFSSILKGVGGLPVGSQGKVVVLFSGDMNSIVASYLVMKRGCIVFPLFLDLGSRDRDLYSRVTAGAKNLARFYPELELNVVPYVSMFQKVERIPMKLGYMARKRLMLKIAEEMAMRVKAGAVVTCESLEDVSSQIMNIPAIDEACSLPVLRPLAGINKILIKRLANQIKNKLCHHVFAYPTRVKEYL